MNTVQRIVKNTGVLFAAQIIAYLLAFVYMVDIARYLGPESFGIFSFATAVVLIFGIFADLGLSTLITRELSRDKSLEKIYIGNFIPIKVILSIIIYSILVLFGNLMGYPQVTLNVLYIFGLFMIINGFSQLFLGVFQAHEKMEYQSISLLINNSIIFLGVLYGISNGFNVEGFAFIYFIAAAVGLLFSFFIMQWKYSPPRLSFNLKFWRKSLTLAIPLSFAIVFSTIAFRVDTVLLGILQGNIAVGWYSAGFRLIDFLLFIPVIYSGAIFPVLAKFHVSSKDLLKILYEKSFKYLLVISIPIVAGTSILAKEIILILFQNSYSESIIALKILIWVIPFMFLINIFGVMFVSVNKQNLMLKITFVVMILNIGLNLIFIPLYSYVGTSIISVVTCVVESVICFYYLSNYINIHMANLFLKPIVASIIMSIYMYFVNLNLFLSIITATILYFGLLILFKTFNEEDYNIIKKLV
jgi:O-antigen/teichoic acid export membrane protein